MASDSNVGGKSLAEDDKLGLDLLPESDFLVKGDGSCLKWTFMSQYVSYGDKDSLETS